MMVAVIVSDGCHGEDTIVVGQDGCHCMTLIKLPLLIKKSGKTTQEQMRTKTGKKNTSKDTKHDKKHVNKNTTNYKINPEDLRACKFGYICSFSRGIRIFRSQDVTQAFRPSFFEKLNLTNLIKVNL